LMPDENTIQKILAANASSYLGDLRRIRGLVQMKITIQTTPASTAKTVPISGTDYLKQRQRESQSASAATEAIKNAGVDIAHEWKQEQRKDATILFALIERKTLNEFKSRISKIENIDAQISVSGPWPPSEFVNSSPELSSIVKND